jgi:hypothetical protein
MLAPRLLQGSIEFSTALRQNRFLTRLNLDNLRAPSLQEECVAHLATMLTVNSSLRELSLGKYQMRDHGAEVLTQHLTRNTALAALHLRWCGSLVDSINEQIVFLVCLLNVWKCDSIRPRLFFTDICFACIYHLFFACSSIALFLPDLLDAATNWAQAAPKQSPSCSSTQTAAFNCSTCRPTASLTWARDPSRAPSTAIARSDRTLQLSLAPPCGRPSCSDPDSVF